MKFKEAPKTIKYKRIFRVKLNNNFFSLGYLFLNFYNFGLKALEYGKLLRKHFNTILRLLKRILKKTAIIKFNIGLIIPVTKKPLEVRMGKGKGKREFWECPIKKGMIIFELCNSTRIDLKLKRALLLVSDKMPFKTKVVKKYY